MFLLGEWNQRANALDDDTHTVAERMTATRTSVRGMFES
jgi:hypothetical protein